MGVKLTRSWSSWEGKAPFPLYSMGIVPIAYNGAKYIQQYRGFFFLNPNIILILGFRNIIIY